ncbi:hypothetical protein lacNasYZ03_01870 [Lactobacillus nasalidis]|uniref:1-acyl-sn-glycerol-3-phosphate acyltransferase n=1 Tax=Lactobacillus nasalidis TaxID=2797258 RepID=A0ABQ3W2I4_9LACO|nr:1-acyl-sn-glycerol-3-phosphate acyltransferase [Lactobacillus nasalidis]GHV98372.1 hypothetical protein lacNasYZ01_15540 [Lactobacillus nasalidis]GHV99530.1 hypothetical protein lacNasYZ02_09600 [Lactobacillus nasalidis]GHW00500.1 hypothetical protein lacNasYZ03_01870 [Lactobacillus nasalidis]
MSKKTYYYRSESDDLVTAAQQDFRLPDGYQVFRKGAGWKVWNFLVRTLALAFAWPYSRLFLLVKVRGKEKLRPFRKRGCFVYGNHTQMLGDPFDPMTIVNPYRYYALAAQANWGIPFLGKYVIPVAGLPVGQDLKQSISLLKDVKYAYEQKQATIVIYPEAHLWPYYTKIRPFPATSLNFPVSLKAPCFAMTTTYQRCRWRRRPKITIYVDGPFYPDQTLGKKAAQEKLHAELYQCMTERAKLSDYEFCSYVKISSKN